MNKKGTKMEQWKNWRYCYLSIFLCNLTSVSFCYFDSVHSCFDLMIRRNLSWRIWFIMIYFCSKVCIPVYLLLVFAMSRIHYHTRSSLV